MDQRKSFASDNNSGAHPRILEAIARANQGSSPAYGEDQWTEKAAQRIREVFGQEARAWFVLLGTAANVLGLKSLVRSHHSILCSSLAHINLDECGAPEAIIGSKLIPIHSDDGKISPEDCLPLLQARESVHHSYPRVLSITQSTERGTVYSLEELRNIGRFCKEHGLYFFMDGARLSNAAAALSCGLGELTSEVGVDALSFGGTKNGLLMGEAVVFLNPSVGDDFPYLRKQHMQLSSKMRFVAAQFIEYLTDELWRENALAANSMAARLSERISGLDHVRIVNPVQANQIFVRMPQKVLAKLEKEFYFYIVDTADEPGGRQGWPMARLMTSFNTTAAEVDAFARTIATAAG